MRYLLLIYGDEAARQAQLEGASPEDQASEMKAWYDYGDWLRDKGWFLGGEALEPTPAATTVRGAENGSLTTDGPFAETKEQLGGYYLIQCQNLDEAIEAARQIPSVAYGGAVEVRPIMEFPEEAS